MLGKYGEASSSSMKNLENGLRDRVLYHQNMLSMTAEFYLNPFPTNSTGGGTIGAAGDSVVQTPKMINSLASSGSSHPSQQQQQHGSNGSGASVGSNVGVSPANSGLTHPSLPQFQCQLCQKCFISNAVLAQHMKTHDGGFVLRAGESSSGNSYVQQQTSAATPSAGVASSSKTSPPLLTQHIIKSEYAVSSAGSTSHSMGQFPAAYGMAKQFECQICHKAFMTMVNLNLHMKIHDSELKSTAAPHMYSQTSGSGAGAGENLLTGSSSSPANFHTSQHGHNSQQHHHSGMLPVTAVLSGASDGLCQICHKTFSTAPQFAAHMKIHENEFKNRALYHSGTGSSNGTVDGGSTTIAASNGGAVDHFYAAQQPTQVLSHAPTPQLDASKGHRCPICHKMSNNIIEHIKQHEGQLTMGSGGSSSGTAGNAGSPAGAVIITGSGTAPVYQEDSQSSLEDESDGAGDSRKHECLICHKKFSSSGNLAIHIRVHSGEKPFKCSVCGKGFIQSNNLATHMKTHTGEKPYACTICGKNFSQSNNLKTHIRTHTGEKPYACTICGKRFNQKNNLTTHMRTHQLVCMVCGVQFMHPSDLANHMKFHNDEKPFICSVCNKVYLNLDELTEHMKKTHNQVKPYRCHICDKTFTQSNNLKTHIKTHIFQDPYKCQMCSRSFQKEDDYSQHMLVHTADKPYECTYCGKRFIQSNNLKTHVRTHTGEKPYRCTICAKNFNQKNNLNTHMRIHTGEKPFECTICDKRFNQSNNLNKHIKTHGQEKEQQQQHAS